MVCKYLIKNQIGGAENDIIQSMIDSAETSVSLKLFPDLKEASYAHIFNTKYTTFLISQCEDLENFNPIRLTDEPYPVENRPRGQKDLDSVIYHREKIKENGYKKALENYTWNNWSKKIFIRRWREHHCCT